MKKLLFGILIISFFSCDNSSASTQGISTSQETYQSAKLTVAESEAQNPLQFLHVQGTYRRNLIGEWVVEGKVENNATVATYKDAQLKIVYYTKTGTEIGSVDRTVIKVFRPSSNETFKYHLDAPSGTNSVGIELEGAAAN